MHTTTPHISAKVGDFAKTVLMSGDPLRAKWAAETFLEDVRKVNDIRGMLGYTGIYEGVRVSTMGSGMGMPSIGIYAHELFTVYGVDNIIRIGSAGALQEYVKLRDVVIAMGASTDSSWQDQYGIQGHHAPCADPLLLENALLVARERGLPVHAGCILSTDTFYRGDLGENTERWANLGILANDMETAALYMEASVARKRALTLLTISDELYGGINRLPAEERQTDLFSDMVQLALAVAKKID